MPIVHPSKLVPRWLALVVALSGGLAAPGTLRAGWEDLAGRAFQLRVEAREGAGEIRAWADEVLAAHWMRSTPEAEATLVLGGGPEFRLRLVTGQEGDRGAVLWEDREALEPGLRDPRSSVDQLMTRFCLAYLRSNPGLVRRRPSLTLPENPGVQGPARAGRAFRSLTPRTFFPR